jgi:hypothetical protein
MTSVPDADTCELRQGMYATGGFTFKMVPQTTAHVARDTQGFRSSISQLFNTIAWTAISVQCAYKVLTALGHKES